MKIETYSCDECGKRRDSDANHWWVLSDDVSGVDYDNRDFPMAAMLVAKWEDGLKNSNPPYKNWHVCGQQCAIAAISRFMSTGKLEK